jgi:biopolymer transport protein ExbB/TolQ
LSQAAEWFPLLGLLGTVAAILQTFNSINGPVVTPQEIIRKYAPAITATGSGLLMALLNILPTWIVNLGRDLIRSIAGRPAEDEWGYLK